MEVQLIGSKKKSLEVSDAVFACEFNGPLVHQVVTAYLAAGRAGTQAQKTRSQVRGGGAKPFAQKGSGRARAGTIRSPLWRKGGVIFAAQPRSYEQKVNKKMYRGAMRSILSEQLRLGRMTVVDSFEVTSNKTKDFLKKLATFKMSDKVLLITNEVNENLYLSSRNLPLVNVCDVAAVSPVALVNAENVLITAAALEQFGELLK
ncbi:50S ribosomal protein L4 [Gammaproteobacteria bacterium SCGC AG-212-F23]|nr:50S ribosomal protein L4 [Gammaproteobacteria bacterium SCGC AG-212-F23]